MPNLTTRQLRFVDIYVSEGNATKAAAKAGFSKRTSRQAGARLLSNVVVRKAIDDRRQGLVAKAGVTAEAVVAELKKIGFSDVRKLVQWRSNVQQMATDEETGEPVMVVANEVVLKDSAQIDDETAGAISSISQGPKGDLKIRFHDKQAALVNLGKHLGIFRDEGGAGTANVTVDIVKLSSKAKAK